MLDKWFKRLIIINLLLVFVVIIAGSIVRVTESGMGCPDWPKCFGKLIPPTNERQVTWHPEEVYHNGQMIIHNEKLYTSLNDFTSNDLFDQSNWEVYTKHNYATYNPVHTWIEFINRLATVALGFPVMAMFGLSFLYWRRDRIKILLSFFVVFLVGFQAWLGKLVVDSNLQGQTITIHMIGVFAIIAVLLLLLFRARRKAKVLVDGLFKNLALVSLIITLAMVIVGTQVREQIDEIAKIQIDRNVWIEQLDWMFILHRSMIYLIVALNLYLIYQAHKKGYLSKQWFIIGAIICIEALLGVALAHFGFPKIAQPLHLLFSTLLFALQFSVFINMKANKDLITSF